MYFVVSPIYDYEESDSIRSFDDLHKAIEFINEELERNKTSTFKNTADDYLLIEGHKVKLKTVEITTRVEKA